MTNVYIKTVEGGEDTTLSDTHYFELDDGTDSTYISGANLKASLKTYNDTLYAVVGHDQSLTLAASVYTATLTNTTNIAASTFIAAYYLRIGSIVFVSGSANIDPTAGGTCVLDITLPIASAFTTSGHLTGTIGDVNGESGVITAEATGDVARATWTAVTVTNHLFNFTFTYRIL